MQNIGAADETNAYKYKFSIVMAVYNVEPFLNEAVDSLLQQTIGFEENVQLILVDDGSLDNSGQICDEYKEQYPENIIVIHKENGGVSSARNEGLKYIQGRYVNFLDSDDKLSENALEEVYLFFAQHDTETDVVAIPMYFFDGQTGEHILNYKFKRGSQVIDLRRNYTYIQLSAATAFFKNSSFQIYKFDEMLDYAEDAKLVSEILLNKMTLGAVSNVEYLYRKRSIGKSSAVQQSANNKKWYLDSIKYFTQAIIEKSIAKMGYIPAFIQFVLMYDLQWKVKQEKTVEGVLNKVEIKEYYERLFKITDEIDDEIILKQKNLDIEYKTFLLRKKYGEYPSVNYCNQDIGLYFKNTYVTNCRNHKMMIEFLKFEDSSILVEGYGVYIPFAEYHDVQVYCMVNDSTILCEAIERPEKEKRLNGELVLGVAGFKAMIPLAMLTENNEVYFYMSIDGLLVKKEKLSWGKYSPVTNQYQNQYYTKGLWSIAAEKNCIKISKTSKPVVMLNEVKFLFELMKSKKVSDKKAGMARILYHFFKLFKRKEIWLLSDRVNKADDNGEVLFLYLQEKKDIKSYFVISEESGDFAKLQKKGKVLPHFSYKHKLKYLLSDKLISAHADASTFNPFAGYDTPYRDIIAGKKIVFLQHGIIKDDISGWLNRYNKNFSIFVTAANAEYQSILENPAYYFDEEQVKLTGLPRYDRLKDEREKIITIMPTWRKYLMKLNLEGTWDLENTFYKSAFLENYRALLNNQELLETSKKYGYKINFMPHPTLQTHIDEFQVNKSVELSGVEKSYQEIYAKSSLVISDYSSAVFDFAYLRKPVVYFQFDSEEFFGNGHVYTKGYFDYERDGLGEVCYDVESLVDVLIAYMENDCRLKDKYRERIDKFFAYNDQNNCQRVYEEILKLGD